MLWEQMTFVKISLCVLWRAGGQAWEKQPKNCSMLSFFNYLLEGRLGHPGLPQRVGYSKNRIHKITD